MPTREEIEQMITGMIDKMSEDELARLKKLVNEANKQQLYEAMMRAAGIVKGGDRN